MVSHRELESNEVGWWSNWANLERMVDGYLLYSKEFLEPLFNHAGLLGPPADVKGFVAHAEERFQANGVPPSFIINSSEEYSAISDRLSERGYRPADFMHVMLLEGFTGKRAGDVRVVVADRSHVDVWSKLYVNSFNEDPNLLGAIKRIVSSVVAHPAVRLLIGNHEGTPSGVLALYTSGRITGVYCVGTLRGKRRKGVATTLLSHAADYASGTNTQLVLQTFESDGVQGFYAGLGFRRVYTKNVWVPKPLRAAEPSLHKVDIFGQA